MKKTESILTFRGYDLFDNSLKKEELEVKLESFKKEFEKLINNLKYNVFYEMTDEKKFNLIKITKLSEIPTLNEHIKNGLLGNIRIVLYNSGDLVLVDITTHNIIAFKLLEGSSIRTIVNTLRHCGITGIKFNTKEELLNKLTNML